MQYTIELSNTENLALGYVAISQESWIENAIRERCRIAIDQIVKIAVTRALEAEIQIPSTREGIVEMAFSEGWVESAADRQAMTDKATPHNDNRQVQ